MTDKSILMLDNILYAKGDLALYPELVELNQDGFRTLNGFLFDKLKERKIQKGAFVEKLGITSQTLNNWEKNGIPEITDALEVAITLGLDLEETNEFLFKYAGMGRLYPAQKLHFQYIYILINRSELETRFPIERQETTKQWISRIFKESEIILSTEKKEENILTDTERVRTEFFLEALLENDIERIGQLRFRSAGESAIQYLEQYIKGSRLEKNYGNRTLLHWGTEEKLNKVHLMDKIFEEEKEKYENIYNKLSEGVIPSKEELIVLGMTLRMTIGQMNELLKACGVDQLSARNLYEGALILVWSSLSKAYPEWFGMEKQVLDSVDISGDEEMEKLLLKEYKKEIEETGFQDFQVIFSRQVTKAFQELPRGLRKQIREVPKWYLSEGEQAKQLEKRRMALILLELENVMRDIWECGIRTDISFISTVNTMLVEDGYLCIDGIEEKELITYINEAEATWRKEVLSGNLEGMTKETFHRLCKQVLSKLENYYFNRYAPKKKKRGTVHESEGIGSIK